MKYINIKENKFILFELTKLREKFPESFGYVIQTIKTPDKKIIIQLLYRNLKRCNFYTNYYLNSNQNIEFKFLQEWQAIENENKKLLCLIPTP